MFLSVSSVRSKNYKSTLVLVCAIKVQILAGLPNMIEIHPFGNFIPMKSKYLMLGSFVTKPANPYEWFYANGRNQFWPIMREVYGLDLSTTEEQQKPFTQLEMALADIILSCER